MAIINNKSGIQILPLSNLMSDAHKIITENKTVFIISINFLLLRNFNLESESQHKIMPETEKNNPRFKLISSHSSPEKSTNPAPRINKEF